MAGEDDSSKVNVVIGNMVQGIGVNLVLVAAVFILTRCIIADHMSLAHLSFIEDLSIDMQKSPILEGQVRYWVLAVGHSGFEAVLSELVVEPCCELGISHPRTSKIIELSDLIFIGHKGGGGMSGERGSQTVSSHSDY